MKIFLDVGAHDGETLGVVRARKWAFDRIVSFEPAPMCWPQILGLSDSRVELCKFGLWKEDAAITLNNPGQVGASVSPDKDFVETAVTCEFRDAAEWFVANLKPEDSVYAKINVEGAEVDIIERLATTGELPKIDHLLVHFDVRKVSSLKHREYAAREQLRLARVEYLSADTIQFGGVIRGTANWLRWCQSDPRWRNLRYQSVARIEFAIRKRAYPLKSALLRYRSSRTGL